MKFSVPSVILATAVASVFASGAMAANPNGPKPKCPIGQILVVEQGAYVCKDATINKPGSNAERRGASSPAKKFAVKAPSKPKPDFKILSATKVGGTSNKFGVQIKNFGADSPTFPFLKGVNHGGFGGTATAPMPQLKAGETKFVFIEFNKSRFKDGDRIVFLADYKNDVAESNENNNKYAINY